MAPRPSSPTSLLWAHQIKRENGHLLGRIQKLESANQHHDNRLKAAESSAKASASEDLAALAEQVKSLDSEGVSRRLADVERGVMDRLDDVQAESEAMVLKMASLEKDGAFAEEEKRKALTKEKAILKRIGEVEENLKNYQASLDRVGRKVDEASVDSIKAQLDGLTKQVKKEGADLRLMEDSVQTLEVANAELRKANERLNGEMKELAKKAAASTPLPAQVAKAAAKASTTSKAPGKRAAPQPELDTEPEEAEDDDEEMQKRPKKKKKKSHKWAGGGADKDIILQASQLNVTPQRQRSTPAKPEKKRPTAPAKAPPKPKTLPKPAAAPAKAAPAKPSPAKGVAKSIKQTKQAQRESQRFIDGGLEKPIIRAGKGWIEIADSPSQESEEDDEEDQGSPAPVKRPRGRPPKQRPSQDNGRDLADGTQRPVRGARSQVPQNAIVPQKRKADAGDAVAGAQKYRPSGNSQAIKASRNDVQAQKGAEGLNSPITSPQPVERKDTKDHLLDAVTSQPGPASEQQPPVKRRRVIDQVKNLSLLQQYVLT